MPAPPWSASLEQHYGKHTLPLSAEGTGWQNHSRGTTSTCHGSVSEKKKTVTVENESPGVRDGRAWEDGSPRHRRRCSAGVRGVRSLQGAVAVLEGQVRAVRLHRVNGWVVFFLQLKVLKGHHHKHTVRYCFLTDANASHIGKNSTLCSPDFL